MQNFYWPPKIQRSKTSTPPKKSFDNPCNLKSGVPPPPLPPLGWKSPFKTYFLVWNLVWCLWSNSLKDTGACGQWLALFSRGHFIIETHVCLYARHLPCVGEKLWPLLRERNHNPCLLLWSVCSTLLGVDCISCYILFTPLLIPQQHFCQDDNSNRLLLAAFLPCKICTCYRDRGGCYMVTKRYDFFLENVKYFSTWERNLESPSGHVLNEKMYGAHLQKKQNLHVCLPNNWSWCFFDIHL